MADSEKDRLGEKLRDKEKAEENRYFAERDKALLEKLKAKAGHCPQCGTALETVERGSKTAEECPACRRAAR
jgi:ribosomal protein L37AE/L43A